MDLKGTGRDTHREGAPRTLISVTGNFDILTFPFEGCFILYVHLRRSLDMTSEKTTLKLIQLYNLTINNSLNLRI